MFTRFFFRFGFSVLVLATIAPSLVTQDEPEVFYVIDRSTPVFATENGQRRIAYLNFRESIQVLENKEGWMRVRRSDNTEGYIREEKVSNVWIRASKSKQMIYVYAGKELTHTIPADFGVSPEDKERRGSLSETGMWRTPEGTFFVCAKNPYSAYYKAFVLNYPTPEDAERGYRDGIISRGERDAIVSAARNYRTPPMGTALGGMIEIHGNGTAGRSNWTRGCIAIRDLHMDDLWEIVQVGTPVIVEA